MDSLWDILISAILEALTQAVFLLPNADQAIVGKIGDIVEDFSTILSYADWILPVVYYVFAFNLMISIEAGIQIYKFISYIVKITTKHNVQLPLFK